MDNQIKVGTVCLLIRDNKVLMGVRQNAVGAGQWGLPGGHLEFGEQIENCAKRELLEETGLVAKSLKFINLVNNPRSTTHYIHLCFLVDDWTGNLEVKEPQKCSEWKWQDLNDLPENIFFGHAGVLQSYKKNKIIFEQEKQLNS